MSVDYDVTSAQASREPAVLRSHLGRRDRRSIGAKLGSTWRGIAGVVIILGVCEFATRLEPVSREFLPYVSDMLREVPGLLVDGEFLENVAATLVASGIALVLATIVGIVLGVALGSSEIAYRISRMVVELLRPIPSVTLIPLLVLIYGPEIEMKVFIATYAALWPILFNAIYAMHDVDPVAKDTARSFGMGRWSVLWRICLPSAAPLIATGVRMSAGIALMVVISAEILTGGSPGIGSFIKISSAGIGQAPITFAAALIAGVIGFLINAAFQTAERGLFTWASREGRAA